MNVCKVLDSQTKFKKNKISNLRKKKSFQFVPEIANEKFTVMQIKFQNAGEAWKKPRWPIFYG